MTRQRNPVRPLLAVATVIALLLAVGFVWVAIVVPRIVAPIERIEFSQAKAVPDFDTTPYVVTDETALADFRQLLLDHQIVPPVYFAPDLGGCAGGTATKLEITYVDGRTAPLDYYDCGSGESFAYAANAVLEPFRD